MKGWPFTFLTALFEKNWVDWPRFSTPDHNQMWAGQRSSSWAVKWFRCGWDMGLAVWVLDYRWRFFAIDDRRSRTLCCSGWWSKCCPLSWTTLWRVTSTWQFIPMIRPMTFLCRSIWFKVCCFTLSGCPTFEGGFVLGWCPQSSPLLTNFPLTFENSCYFCPMIQWSLILDGPT